MSNNLKRLSFNHTKLCQIFAAKICQIFYQYLLLKYYTNYSKISQITL